MEVWPSGEPARWIVDRIHAFGRDVGSIIPDAFAAYARVLHPANQGDRPVRWSEIAEKRNATVHREMQWANISGSWEHSPSTVPSVWDHEPDVGSLPADLAARLVALLRPRTTTPGVVWYAVWDGWGGTGTPLRRAWRWSRGRRPVETPPLLPGAAAVVHLPSRHYVLLRGSIDDATRSLLPPPGRQSAALWWPEDQTWCVATEIDLCWTYVGGPEAAIGTILDDSQLEALRARISDGIGYASDRINPQPPGNPFAP